MYVKYVKKQIEMDRNTQRGGGAERMFGIFFCKGGEIHRQTNTQIDIVTHRRKRHRGLFIVRRTC